MRDELLTFSRFVWGLRQFLREPLTLERAQTLVCDRLRDREQNFLRIVRRGMLERPGSPYAQLLSRARIGFDDLARQVRRHGLESALEWLHAEGVYVSLEEFKGRRPIERTGGFTLPVRPHDFDNPFLAGYYEGTTGGSRSAGARILVDLDLVAHEAAYHLIYQNAFGLTGRPMAIWRPLPPGTAGLKNSLYQLKSGGVLAKWFHQNRQPIDVWGLKYRLFTGAAVYGSRLMGRALPVPTYAPPTDAIRVARWLADRRRRGRPALLDSTASSAVRVCQTARRHGLDLADTFFRVGGEPYTRAKARVIADAGARASPHYSMSEVGRIGVGCAAPSQQDDIHILLDKFALIQRNRPIGDAGVIVPSLLLTTLHPSSPKLMLNTETDDYAVLERRDCGCPIGRLGFSLHAHTLRSFEKLSSEGMSFIGSHLIDVIEEVLPSRFGGGATDYQFVEEEVDGLPKVSLVISPRLGAIDEHEVIATVLRALGGESGAAQMMADVWRAGETLRVLRREPSMTDGAKILPLHIIRSRTTAAT